MYSREEVKAITDKVIDMAKADAVEVEFNGGERSATRFANSSITANLIEHDQEISVTVYYGQKTASASTHQAAFSAAHRAITPLPASGSRMNGRPSRARLTTDQSVSPIARGP